MKEKNFISPAKIFRKSGLSFLFGFFLALFFKNYFNFIPIPFSLIFGSLFFILCFSLFDLCSFKKYSFLLFIFFLFGFLRPFLNFSLTLPFYPLLLDFSLKIKNFLEEKLSIFFNSFQKEFLMSLFFGARNHLSYPLKEKIQKVGLSHIVAVSGFHLSFLNKGLSFLFYELFALNKYLNFFLIIIFDFLFVLCSNFSPSVIRSFSMAFLVLLASLNYRFYYPTNALIFTLCLMIFLNPEIFFDIGFQLSFLATFSLLYFYPLLEKLVILKDKDNSLLWEDDSNFFKNLFQKFKNSFFQIFLLNFSALIFTAPLVLYYFSSFSFLSPVTNMLILPIIPLIMGLSVFFFIFSSFSFYFSLFFASFLKILINYCFLVIDFFSTMNWANFSFPSNLRFFFLVFYPLLFLFFYFLKNKIKV